MSGARIERLEENGRVFWIKRAETLSLRLRLQKGEPRAAFDAERAAHKRYLALGLPVPEIVDEGPGFIKTADAGATLRHLLWSGEAGWTAGLEEAARGLARFHAAGVTHGRPSLKDTCWQDGRITFLDFERAGRGSQALDLLLFLFSIVADTGGDRPAFEVARNAYLGDGDPAVLEAAKARVRLLRPAALALKPVAWVQPKNREFQAIGPFVKFVLET